MKSNIRIYDHDAKQQADIQLPFVPTVGLHVRVPFDCNDYRQIDEVYWDEDMNRFIVYLTELPRAITRQSL